MNLQVLIATMHQKDVKKLIKDMNVQTDAVVVNQCDEIKNIEHIILEKRILEIVNKDRGLSRSRNEAIENSDANICVIADDDYIYNENYENLICNTYKRLPDADIIAFKYNDTINHKKFPNKVKKLNYLTIMKISSAQITFKRNKVLETGVKFDEDFGAGSKKYLSGEENIFLKECLKKGLKAYFVPIEILKLDSNSKSTWFKRYDEQYFITKGAIFYALFSKLSIFIIVQFAIRKYKIYKKDLSLKFALKYMLEGKNEYKKKRAVNKI